MSNCLTIADLREWLLQFARRLGFYGARYTHVGTSWVDLGAEDVQQPRRHLTTALRDGQIEDEWLARDPCAARVRSAFVPFAWSTGIIEGMTAAQRSWLEQERERGVAAGVAIPVHDSIEGPAYLSLFGSSESAVADLIEEHAPELAFVAAQFHVLAKTLIPIADWMPRLSNREIECLRLAALGKTVSESGETLGLSGRTVEFHLRNASEKLGAATKIRAVVLAFGSGLTHV